MIFSSNRFPIATKKRFTYPFDSIDGHVNQVEPVLDNLSISYCETEEKAVRFRLISCQGRILLWLPVERLRT